jgi:hypothetical protein
MTDPIPAAPVEIVPIHPVKPGVKTTEFWVTVVAMATALAEHVPAPWGWITLAVANAAYALSRGLAKQPRL